MRLKRQASGHPNRLGVSIFVFLSFVSSGLFLLGIPLYLASLGASSFVIGLSLASAGLAEAFLVFKWGAITDRYGPIRPLLIGGIATAVFYLALGLSNSLALVLLLRVGVAAARSVLFVAGRVFFSLSFDVDKQGAAMGFFSLLFWGGLMLGFFVAGIALNVIEVGDLFLLSGTIQVLAILLGALTIEFKRPPSSTSVPSSRTKFRQERMSWRELIGGRQRIGVFAVTALLTAAWISINGFIPLYITESAELPASSVGVILGIATGLGTVFVMLAGKLVDAFGELRVLRLGLTVILVAVATFALPLGFVAITIAMSGVMIGRASSDPSLLSVLARTSEATQRGRTFSVYVLALDAGLIVGPILMGASWELFGARGAFWLPFVLVGLALAFASRTSDDPIRVEHVPG